MTATQQAVCATPAPRPGGVTLDGILKEAQKASGFAVTGSEVILCSGGCWPSAPRLSSERHAERRKRRNSTHPPGAELVLEARINVPAEITVCICDAQGKSRPRRPAPSSRAPRPGGVTRLYWDRRTTPGRAFPPRHTLPLETVIRRTAKKATVDITVR